MTGPLADRHEAAYAHWSRLHGGLDPRGTFWVAGWVRLTHACARPLARRAVSADQVTLAGVGLTATVPLLAALGSLWPLLATVVLVAAAVLDGVDGALAAQTGTASARGRVLDALADRVCDVLLVVAVVVLGAPLWAGALVGALTLLLEGVRASAQAAGMTGPGAVTVWERPSRVIVAAFGTALWSVEWAARRLDVDLLADVDGEVIVTAGVAIAAVLAAVGLLHVTRASLRALR